MGPNVLREGGCGANLVGLAVFGRVIMALMWGWLYWSCVYGADLVLAAWGCGYGAGAGLAALGGVTMALICEWLC